MFSVTPLSFTHYYRHSEFQILQIKYTSFSEGLLLSKCSPNEVAHIGTDSSGLNLKLSNQLY